MLTHPQTWVSWVLQAPSKHPAVLNEISRQIHDGGAGRSTELSHVSKQGPRGQPTTAWGLFIA